MTTLDRLIPADQIINRNRLYRGRDDVPGSQHAGEQCRREHQREDNQPHLCATPRDIAYANPEKDGIAERQQRHYADNRQRRGQKYCCECIDWNAKEMCHMLLRQSLVKKQRNLRITKRARVQTIITDILWVVTQFGPLSVEVYQDSMVPLYNGRNSAVISLDLCIQHLRIIRAEIGQQCEVWHIGDSNTCMRRSCLYATQ